MKKIYKTTGLVLGGIGIATTASVIPTVILTNKNKEETNKIWKETNKVWDELEWSGSFISSQFETIWEQVRENTRETKENFDTLGKEIVEISKDIGNLDNLTNIPVDKLNEILEAYKTFHRDRMLIDTKLIDIEEQMEWKLKQINEIKETFKRMKDALQDPTIKKRYAPFPNVKPTKEIYNV